MRPRSPLSCDGSRRPCGQYGCHRRARCGRGRCSIGASRGDQCPAVADTNAAEVAAIAGDLVVVGSGVTTGAAIAGYLAIKVAASTVATASISLFVVVGPGVTTGVAIAGDLVIKVAARVAATASIALLVVVGPGVTTGAAIADHLAIKVAARTAATASVALVVVVITAAAPIAAVAPVAIEVARSAVEAVTVVRMEKVAWCASSLPSRP